MRDMTARDRAELDRHITGNFGEDQLRASDPNELESLEQQDEPHPDPDEDDDYDDLESDRDEDDEDDDFDDTDDDEADEEVE